MTKEEALHKFWSSFGLTAYDENSVPKDAQLPYIRYQCNISEFGDDIGLTATLWCRTSSWRPLSNKIEEIYDTIGLGGITIPFNGGILWVKRAVPFSSRLKSQADETVLGVIVNIRVEFITNK